MLEITRDGQDLYPEIKRRAALKNLGKLEMDSPEKTIALYTEKYGELPERWVERIHNHYNQYKETGKHSDMVRYELMKHFGYYITESSEHNAEYTPYFIKDKYPELIDRFNIPLDEYPRRCVHQIEEWAHMRDSLVNNPELSHVRTQEYASYILDAMETDNPVKIGGNVLNHGSITNLPRNACVEVPCVVDRSGVVPTIVGALPEQLAALTRTNINVHLMTIEAARTLKKEHIYQAAMLDPHTSSELSLDDIVSLCDDLIAAHGDWLPAYQ
ncbi:MAG: hypothetical protein GX810_03315 [Clostridiales bacterium]|nr:hypothetical protein [Clostridiales bacterium]